MATSWAWTVRLGFVWTDHEGGRQQSLEGDEFNKAAPAPPAPPPAPAAPGPATGENGDRPADEHPRLQSTVSERRLAPSNPPCERWTPPLRTRRGSSTRSSKRRAGPSPTASRPRRRAHLFPHARARAHARAHLTRAHTQTHAHAHMHRTCTPAHINTTHTLARSFGRSLPHSGAHTPKQHSRTRAPSLMQPPPARPRGLATRIRDLVVTDTERRAARGDPAAATMRPAKPFPRTPLLGRAPLSPAPAMASQAAPPRPSHPTPAPRL